MIDLHTLKERLRSVHDNIMNRALQADAELTLALYETRNKVQTRMEELRRQRNDAANRMKDVKDPQERGQLIEEGKTLKTIIAELEVELGEISRRLFTEAAKIPNMAHPDAPLGADDSANREIKQVGVIPTFSFEPKDHVQLAEALELVSFEAGAKVTGPKFYFLQNEAVLMEWALVRYAMDILIKHKFKLYQTPDLAKTTILEGIGFNPRGSESNIYPLEGEDLCLVGTAEITLGGYHANEILDLSSGPLYMAGVSHCFRREAGASGQFSKGLYRVHQFTKVEMFVFCKPDESDAIHEQLRTIEEEIFVNLGIPFRVVDTAVGDLGAPAYRKYDLEAWMPGRGDNGDWGEITSTSNCTDFQSRRLNVRFKDTDGKNRYVHTLNGTAVAVSRALVAIIENNQQEDGSIIMPNVLIPYLGFDRITPKQ
jgi:seryl-tRNA synthetase